MRVPRFFLSRSKAKHISKAPPTPENIAQQHPQEQEVVTDPSFVGKLIEVEQDRQQHLKLCPSCEELKDSRNFVPARKLDDARYKADSPVQQGTLICKACNESLFVADMFAGHRP